MPLLMRCTEDGRPLAVVIADIDRFKTVNDRFGHAVGDLVLQRFAAHMSAMLRPGDLFGRLGGEEFVLLLPDTDGNEAVAVMETARGGLAPAVHDLLSIGSVTASFGIASLWRGETLREMIQRADEALYRSKMDGRDRITLCPRTPAGKTVRYEQWTAEEPRKAVG